MKLISRCLIEGVNNSNHVKFRIQGYRLSVTLRYRELVEKENIVIDC